MKYSTKALTVDAMQFLGDENWRAFQKFMQIPGLGSSPVVLSIRTRNGSIKLTPRDWVIRDEHGDFWPMTQVAFNAIFTEYEDEFGETEDLSKLPDEELTLDEVVSRHGHKPLPEYDPGL